MPGNKDKPNQEQGRPTGIKVLSIIYFLISLFYLLKFSQVLLQWSRLEKLSLTISPFYLAADSTVWCVSGLILVWGLWAGKSWTRPAVLILSLLYSLVFWADRIWIAEPEGLAQRWPVNLVLTITGLGFIILILNRKSSRDYFQKNPAKIP
jgi:hypothetical protein